jgi:translation initiation factor 1 (eIF-1/SUI1)
MSGNWLDASATSNRYIQTYVKGFVDISGGNLLLRPGNNHIIVQGGDISLNGRLFIGTSVLSGDGPTVTSGNVFVGNYVAANTLPTTGFLPGNIMTPATLSATTASWTNTSINWTATASSNAAGFSPYMAFTANIAGNVAVAGNVVGNGWLSATAGYNATTGLYTGNTYTTPVSTVGTVAGEWIQIQGNTATALTGFQLVATNDSTGAHNDRLPTAFTIVGSTGPINYITPWNNGAPLFVMSGNPMLYSYNALNWTASTTIPFNGFGRYAVYNSNMWVAFGYATSNNCIAYSYNGITWTIGTGCPANNDLRPGAWSGTMWVAGGNGYVGYSYDGINWNTATQNTFPTTAATPQVVIFNTTTKTWIAIGANATVPLLAYSYNGITWTTGPISGLGLSGNYSNISYNGTMWVGGFAYTHYLSYSYDGLTWTGLGTSIMTNYPNGIANNGTMWIATPNTGNVATLYYSYNGINWSSLNTGISNASTLYGITYNGTLFASFTSTQGILYSYNGLNWTLATSAFTSNSPQGIVSNYSGPLQTYSPILSGTFTSNPYSPSTNAITGNGAATAIYTIPTTTVTNASQGALTYSTYGNSLNTYLYYRMIVTKIAGNTYGVPTASVSGNVGGFWLPTFQNVGKYVTTVVQPTYTTTTATVSANILNTTFLFTSSTPIYSNVTTTSVIGNTLLGTTSITAANIVPNSASALASASWVNNSISWTASASSNAVNYPPNAAFPDSVAGSGWMTATSAYTNDTTGAYTGNVVTTLTTGANVAGEWLQLQGSVAQPIVSFQLAAPNDTTNNGALPQTFTIAGVSQFNGPAAAYWPSTIPPPVGTMWVAGTTSNYMYYSYNGILWTVSPTATAGTAYDAAYSGTMWVVVTNTAPYLYYSYTGITWTGISNTPFTGTAWGVTTSGTMWVVAAPSTTNAVAYSYNGVNWTGLGSAVSQVFQFAYSGTMWLGGSSGTNLVYYSYNGTQWTGITGSSMFANYEFGVATNGSIWVMVGQGTNSIAYSYNGTTWTGLGTTIFGSNGYGVATSGTMWVATGVTTNTLAYSYTGTVWTGLGSPIGTGQYGQRIAYSGSMWVTANSNSTYTAYSYNGINWTVPATSGIPGSIQAVASNAPLYLNNVNVTSPVLSGSFTTNPFVSGNAATGTGSATATYTIPSGSVTNATQGALTYSTYGNALNSYISYRLIVSNIAAQKFGASSATVNQRTGGFWFLGLGSSTTTTLATYQYNASTVTQANIVGYNKSQVALTLDPITPNQLDLSGGSLSIASGNAVVSSLSVGNIYTGTIVQSNIAIGNVLVGGCVMTPATLSATTASWTNTSINWTASASSNAAGFSPYMAFTANIAGNVAVAGNVVGNGWLSATAGYNATTGLYTGNTYTSTVSTIGTVAGEWIQIQGNTATALTGFQLVATNDSTGPHNDRLPTAFTITGTNGGINYITPWNNGSPMFVITTSSNTATFCYSYNGINWTTSPSNPFSNYGYYVAYNSTIWVAAGFGTNPVAYSYNGITWTNGTGVTTNIGIRPTVWSGTMWVTSGNGYIGYSYNGINWSTATQSMYTNGNSISNFFIFNTTTNMWTTAGYMDAVIKFGYSYNGITWTAGSISGLGFSSSYSVISYNGTIWVAGFQSTHYISYSYDGFTWTGLGTSITANYPNGIANNGTMWIATPNSGNVATLYYSYNGINWSSLNTGLTVTASAMNITYNGTLFVATVGTGQTIYSYNGLNWTLNTNTYAGGTANPQGLSSNYSGQVFTYFPIVSGSFTSNPYSPSTNAITGNGAATAIYTIPTTTVTNATQGALTYSTYGNSTNSYLTYRMIVTKIAGNTYGVPTASVSGNVGGFWLPTFQNTATGYNLMNQYNYSQQTTGAQAAPNGSLVFTGSIPTYSTTVTANVYSGNTFVANTVGANNTIVSTYNINYNPTVTSTAITGYTKSSVTMSINTVTPNQLDISGSLAMVGGTPALTTYIFGNVYTGSTSTNVAIGNVLVLGCVMTPATLSATTASWSNTSINWTASASSNAAGFSPYMAFTANIAGNVAVAGNVVGNGWLSATAGYNATTGLYTGNTYTTVVSTVGTVAGEWIQIQGNTATALTGFQLVATNDSTGPHNDRLPTAFTIVGIKGGNTPVLSAANWGKGTDPPVGTMWVSVGTSSGTSTTPICYSYNGINWTGVTGSNSFIPVPAYPAMYQGSDIAYSGTMWIFTALASNALVYSYNGINWTGLGNPTGANNQAGYQVGPWGIATNGTMWIHCCAGSYTSNWLSYSYDGFTWTGLGTTRNSIQPFDNGCYKAAYNGTMWVAGGSGTNALAYSYTGTVWTATALSSMSPTVYDVASNGAIWVAGTQGSNVGINYNALCYSYDGFTWVGLGTSIIVSCYGIATSGTTWVAIGYGTTHTMVYSYTGTTWTGLGTSIISSLNQGSRVAYSGSMWVATSGITPYFAYSYNGVNWTVPAASGIGSQGYAVASNAPLMAKNIINYPILSGTFTSNPYNPTTNAISGNGAATAIYTIPTTTVTNATQGALTYSTYGNSTNTYLYYRMIVTKIAGNTYGVPTASVSGNVGGFWLPTFQNTIPGITTLNQNSYTPIVVNTSASTTQGSITLSTKVPVYSTSVTGNQLVSNVLTGTIYSAGNTTYNYSLTYSPLVIANSVTGYTTNAVQLAMDATASNQLNLTGNLNVTGTVYPTSMSESFTTITTSTSPLTLNFGNGATFYLTSPPATNFTCNITNVPSAIGRTYLCTLIITASSTKTFCNSVQINGNTAITPYFANGIPTSITTGTFITQTIAIQRILAGDVAGCVNVLSTITPWY